MAAVARFPFVSKLDILRSHRPGTDASNRTFRTLGEHGLVTKGIAVRQRRAGRLAGQIRCYSTLNLDVAVLARHERTEEARNLVTKANDLEAESLPVVDELLAPLDIEDFEAFRRARNLLVHGLLPVAVQQEVLHQTFSEALAPLIREEFVRVAERGEQWTTLAIVGQVAADVRALVVDSFLLTPASLIVGDIGVLRIEHSAGTSLVSLLPAVEEIEEAPFELDEEFAPYFRDEPLSESLRDRLALEHHERDEIPAPARIIPLAS